MYPPSMASHHDSALSIKTITTNADSTVDATARSSFFRNRFRNASLLSLSSVRTLLPRYSVFNTLEEPPASPLSEFSTDNCESPPYAPSSNIPPTPPRYSLLEPRQSLVSTRRTSTATSFEVEGDPQAHEFRYSYPIRAKNPWATLHLQIRDAPSGTRHSKSLQHQPRVPRCWSCNHVTGAVQLDLDSPQNIQQISITLSGSIMLSFNPGGSLPFLKREFTVWDKLIGDPLQSDNTGTEKKKTDSRLFSGQYSFPFSFSFPTQADPVLNTNSISPFSPRRAGTTLSSTPSPSYGNGPNSTEKSQRRRTYCSTSALDESPSPSKKSKISGHPQTSLGWESCRSFASPMPQTFIEKGVDPNVAYDISVRIVHGRFKTNSKIKTNIAYFPALEPLPVSPRRREAYEAGASIPCPMDDPEGWFALPTVKSYGVVKIGDDLFHNRVNFTLYIAQPLSYTRGSLIPCFITIYSEDVEVAHLLSSTERPSVRLLRRVWHPVANNENPSPDQGSCAIGGLDTSWVCAVVSTSVMNLVTHDVGCANWWMPSEDIVQSSNARHLEGEIHLSPDLQPSCDFELFRIEYAVELLAFRTANFTPEVHSPSMLQKGDNVIASNPVEIMTLYRQDEPVPTAYSELPKTYHKLRISSDKGALIPKF